jgi:hypothetical protein
MRAAKTRIGRDEEMGIKMTGGIRRFWSKGLVLIGALVAAGALATPLAHAEFRITKFYGTTTVDGELSRQAGAHPDLTTAIAFPFITPPGQGRRLDGRPQTIKVALPPGLIGNPTALPTCSQPQLVAAEEGKEALCPAASQVGQIILYERANANEEGDLDGVIPGIPVPVYNLERPANLPGLFGFNYGGVVVRIEPTVRPGDFGVTSAVSSISEAKVITAANKLTLWGVPADAGHDSQRIGLPGTAAPRPFLTSPTSCSSTPSVTTAEADTWQNPGAFVHAEFNSDVDGVPFLWEGCEQLRFEPSVKVQARGHQAAAPTGFNIDLAVPQDEDPDHLATADVRNVAITFPRGFSVSPSSAAGLGGCAPDQINLESNEAPTCPNSSKIGTVRVKTPLLEEELEGDVIVAKQDDNPFHSLVALYLSIKGPGFYLKLPGRVDLDSATGRVTSTFSDTPQLPFEELHVSLQGGPAAPLQAPRGCGTYTTHTEITSWASAVPVSLDSPIVIDEGCATGGFNPGLHAGTANPLGGGFSPFNLQVTRNDGEQNLSWIEATLPPGLLAKLAGVPLCGDAQAASGACPAASQVGTTTVGAGPGPAPIYVPEAGKAPTAVYLAGPYGGAPYSLVVKVPAQAGPFDLGTVVVRNALYVDPITAQVTAKSDPLPQILEGIPIDYRDVRVEINRPNFTLNPTSCDPMKVAGTLTSIEGASASPSARFQASGCGELAFKPSLALSFKGQTRRTGNPALTAVLKAPAGQANIAKTTVILPASVFIDNRHINNPCTRIQFAADACPVNSILGTATAYTPLLEMPLTGPVYFRSNGGERKLPDLVADLNGQIHLTLVGFIDSVKSGKESSRARTRFQGVPDAPVSKFELKLYGGKRGLIQNSTNICRDLGKATVQMTGQNAKPDDFEQKIATQCGSGKKHKPAKGGGKNH